MITSIHNEQLKKWRKLWRKKYRMEMNIFIVEGMHLVEAAHASDWEIETIIVQDGFELPSWVNKEIVTVVSETVYKSFSQMETPQGIAAIVKMKKLTPTTDNFVLLIDAIQDPGNLGTIIRTADAAGFSKVVLGNGTVDLYNEKVIRATQGSLFHIPVEQENLFETVENLKRKNYTVLATALQDARHYNEVELTDKVAIIVGNEGAGVQEELINQADHIVKIPIYGKAESLNVSIAAAILMFHLRN